MQDRAAPIPVVFRSSRRKWLWVLAGSVLAVALAVFFVAGGESLGWFPLVFFGLCAAVGLAMIVLPPSLAIDDEGMTLRQFGRRVRYEFQECGQFRPWGTAMVVFDCESPSHGWLSRANVRLAGGAHCYLPDTFGMSAEGLAAMLNERRARSVQR